MSNTLDTTERYFTIKELEKLWGIGREAIRRVLQGEAGVIRVYSGPLKENARYRVPESVALKIERELFQVNQGSSSNE